MPSSFFKAEPRAIFRDFKVLESRTCPGCSIQRILRDFRRCRQSSTCSSKRVRHASTLASTTAVHANKDIPPALQDLHGALRVMKKAAGNYVNLSKVELASRGLESRNPTIRIAVLGLQSLRSARRLARLITADPLSPLGEWEDQLVQLDKDQDVAGQGLLLRYGPSVDLSTSRSMVPLLQIPSRILQHQGVEIFVSSLSAGGYGMRDEDEQRMLQRTALIPMVSTPGSFAGNVSMIRHPVHVAMVIADGLVGCSTLNPWLSKRDESIEPSASAVNLSLNLPRGDLGVEVDRSLDQVHILDLSAAEQALETFRSSKENAVQYEKGWREGGMPAIMALVGESTGSSEAAPLKPAIANLLNDAIEEADEAINRRESECLDVLAQPVVSGAIAKSLDVAISDWARRGHTELRDELELAYLSRSWAKLRWWKLFWRVDDVNMILEDLLDRRWLVTAEKGVYWLAGRNQELSITEEDVTLLFDDASKGSRGNLTAPDPQYISQRWPLLIPFERHKMKQEQLPRMQALAQSLVLQTTLFTATSGGLSTLLYFYLSFSTIYEVGAVAALGLAWSLRRMQRLWESSRQSLQSELEERGRITLRQTEEMMRAKIAETRDRKEDDHDVQDRKSARDAVANARAALAALTKRVLR